MKPWRIRRLVTTSSTNDDAKRAAEAGEGEGLVVHALQQTAGRGRHGRTWHSPEGNLYCSALLRPGDARLFGHYSFVAALALADTVRAFVPQVNITLKWPNDVLVNGKKIGGILLEAGEGWLVIGMGLNIRHYPDNAMYPATSLYEQITSSRKIFSSSRASEEKENLSGTQSAFPQELGLKPSSGGAPDWVPDKFAAQIFRNDVNVVDDVLKELLDRLAHWHETLQRQSFAPIRAAWLEQAQKGRLSVHLPDGVVEGEFKAVDEQGCLILRLADGAERVIATGDVFFV